MKKYEVRRILMETRDGKDCLKKWNNRFNQDTELIKSFDTLEEAQAFYATVETDVRKMGGALTYYLHEGKCIEENTYDDEDPEEWVSGGDWWRYEIPEIE